MAYVTPQNVVSPQHRITDLQIIYDGDEGGWSLAKMKWDGNIAIGIRWNGSSNNANPSCTGNPQSSGHPTWFILPDEIAWVTLALVQTLQKENVI